MQIQTETEYCLRIILDIYLYYFFLISNLIDYYSVYFGNFTIWVKKIKLKYKQEKKEENL